MANVKRFILKYGFLVSAGLFFIAGILAAFHSPSMMIMWMSLAFLYVVLHFTTSH